MQRRLAFPVVIVAITILNISLWNSAAGNPDPSSSISTPARISNGFWSSLRDKNPFNRRNRNKRTTIDALKSKTTNRVDSKQDTMGQATRMYRYDRAENERNAIPSLAIGGTSLEWHRLDDGVMGGRSESLHHANTTSGVLHFAGTINTNGGGFCSIRSPIPGGLPAGTTGIRLRIRGDGKTYKLTLSDGEPSRFGPSKRGSWQLDIPTQPRNPSPAEREKNANDDYETITIPFSALEASFGPRAKTAAQKAVRFDVNSVRQIGFMLSLQLSDGSPNPVETFGSGIFPFSLEIDSIDPVLDTET